MPESGLISWFSEEKECGITDQTSDFVVLSEDDEYTVVESLNEKFGRYPGNNLSELKRWERRGKSNRRRCLGG